MDYGTGFSLQQQQWSKVTVQPSRTPFTLSRSRKLGATESYIPYTTWWRFNAYDVERL